MKFSKKFLNHYATHLYTPLLSPVVFYGSKGRVSWSVTRFSLFSAGVAGRGASVSQSGTVSLCRPAESGPHVFSRRHGGPRNPCTLVPPSSSGVFSEGEPSFCVSYDSRRRRWDRRGTVACSEPGETQSQRNTPLLLPVRVEEST